MSLDVQSCLIHLRRTTPALAIFSVLPNLTAAASRLAVRAERLHPGRRARGAFVALSRAQARHTDCNPPAARDARQRKTQRHALAPQVKDPPFIGDKTPPADRRR